MATLSTLRDRVEKYLIDVPTATSDLIDNWINKALLDLMGRHNFRFQEAEQSFTTSPNTRKLDDLPSDWKEARSEPWIHDGLGGARLIDWAVSQSQMRALFSEDDTDDEVGPPMYVRQTDTELEVYPYPDDNSLWNDGNYRVIVPYWKYLAALSDDGDSNVITEDHDGEWYIVFAAAAEGFLFNRDREEATVYFNRAGTEAQKFISRDKKSYLHRRITLAPNPDVYGVRRGRHGMRPRLGRFHY